MPRACCLNREMGSLCVAFFLFSFFCGGDIFERLRSEMAAVRFSSVGAGAFFFLSVYIVFLGDEMRSHVVLRCVSVVAAL